MNNKTKGIMYIILAALSFATMSLFIQLVGELPVAQMVFFRNLVALAFSYGIIKRSGGDFSYKKENLKYFVLRSVFGCIGVFTNYYAIQNLLLSDATMINKLAPFFVILFSFLILKERIKLWQVCGIVVAFISSIFIINPDLVHSVLTGAKINTSLGSFPAIIGVFGAICAGMAYTFIRRLTLNGERGTFVVFFFSVFSTIFCIPLVIMDYAYMSITQLILLIISGVFASLGQFAVTSAYASAPAKEISVFDYSQILFSALYSFIFFGAVPGVNSIIGYILIISVAVFMYLMGRREDKRNSA